MHSTSIIATLLVILAAANRCAALETDSFKINKLNLIYNKAQHSLGTAKLKDLRSDLLKHELDELSLKKMKAHNNDKEGLFEASVRKKLLSILTKYELDRFYHDIHYEPVNDTNKPTSNNRAKHAETEGLKSDFKMPSFRDSKLEKLWKKAEKSGFSQEQLMILHQEFEHQQEKLDEHYETMNMIQDSIDKSSSASDRSENTIEFDYHKDSKKKSPERKKTIKETPEGKKARLDDNSHQTLKEKHSAIKKGYEKLHDKITTGHIDETAPFEDDQLNGLWSEALKGSFSEHQLVSLREEFEHFETRMKKLRHFQLELERNRVASKEATSHGEDDDETKHIRMRVEDLGQKIDKTLKNLKKKVETGAREEL